MSSTGGISAPDTSELGFREALIVAAGILGILIFFIIFRFVFNIFLDVLLLDQIDRARRSIQEVWRKICPRWNRRTQPEQQQQHEGGTQQGESNNASNGVELSNVATDPDRLARLEAILISRQVTADDVKVWKEKHVHIKASHDSDEEEAASESSEFCVVCSICLQDLNEGTIAFTAKCEHIFHQHCIHQWVSSRRTDCPYCRADIVSLATLSAVLDSSNSPPERPP
jgi:hypothetical protein